MLQKMKRIQVVGPKKEFSRVVDLLYHEGTLHLEDVCQCVTDEELHLTKVEKEKTQEVADILSTISGLLVTLPKIKDDIGAQAGILYKLQDKTRDEKIRQAQEVIRELESVTKELATRKSELKLSITALDRYEKVLNIIQPMERELPVLENYEVTILLIQKNFLEVVNIIRKEMETLTDNRFEMTSTSVDDETIATIIVFHKRYSQQVHSFIYSVNVNEVRLPQEYMGRPFYEMFGLIEDNKAKATEELKLIDQKLAWLSTAWYQELVVLKKIFDDMIEELGEFNKFGHSEFTFVIMGWIPKNSLNRAKEALKNTFGDTVVVQELQVNWDLSENTPICYNNPRWVKPFEIIMKLVSPPAYREIDPSPILAIFFPIFFGLMVGDIGYGLVILAFALLIKKIYSKVEFATNMADILIISSIPTIIFGYLFGEFFGNFGEMMGWLHPVHFLGITWNRVDALIPMLVLAIAIGVIHVVLGLCIGMANAITMKSKKHVSEKAGMLIIIASILLFLAIALEFIPPGALLPTIVLVIAAILLIIYGAGAVGCLEIMGTIGNILSYARLMAIGMASVILALVANSLGGSMEVVAVGIFIAVMLHALNIALAMFSPSIHSMRLHLVEFFSKFYKGGGVVYKPFKKAGTEEGLGQ